MSKENKSPTKAEIFRRVNKLKTLNTRYLKLISIKEGEMTLFNQIFHYQRTLAQRKGAYRKNKLLIGKLKKLFKLIVLERDYLSRVLGYKNYIELIISTKKIPHKTAVKFVANSKKLVKDTESYLKWPNHLPKWYWSPLNFPNPLVFLNFEGLKLPEDVFAFYKKNYPEFNKLMLHLELFPQSEDYPFCEYDKKTKKIK
ncbi:hypothetical protein HY045_02730, partial [Candidatus Woesebacteria bacterium]|nr:hypothetical protein [Candidatus Woesebacteria bacterium]